MRLCACGDSLCTIPNGFCHCKCGGKTTIAKQTYRQNGVVKGQPYQFIRGHHSSVHPAVEQAVPFKLDGVYCRLVPLSHGLYAIVDATDYEWLMQWKWHAKLFKRQGRVAFYAARSSHESGQCRTALMHREILQAPDGIKGDHIEPLQTLDNRRSNLRMASHSQNAMNRVRSPKNTSGFKGATFIPRLNKWEAQIAVNGKKIYLGIRSTPEAAHALYCSAALKYHGEFARTK